MRSNHYIELQFNNYNDKDELEEEVFFTIPLNWLKHNIIGDFITLEDFLSEYSSIESRILYLKALSENVIETVKTKNYNSINERTFPKIVIYYIQNHIKSK